MKRCTVCGETKPLEDFMWKRKALGQRDYWCRACRAAYKQAHYAANKQRYRDNARAWNDRTNRERVLWLLEYFKTHPCVDCGESDPVVLEFDHLRDKEFDIGVAMRGGNWARILAEIEKCVVRCANCHRRKTAKDGGFARVFFTGWTTIGNMSR